VFPLLCKTRFKAEAGAADPMDKPGLERRLQFLEQTRHGGHCVAVAQRDRRIQEEGLGHATHRKRMVKEDLETKFETPNDPLRMVFVCAMWVTR